MGSRRRSCVENFGNRDRERQVAAPVLCKSGWDGKACSKHRCGQYANYLKWPHGPPQTSPHAHPRLQRVSLYATHTRVADPTRLLTLTIRFHMRKR